METLSHYGALLVGGDENCRVTFQMPTRWGLLVVQQIGLALEVAIGCTVSCRASAIIYRVLEFMAIIN